MVQQTTFPSEEKKKKKSCFVAYLTFSVDIYENIFDSFEDGLVWAGIVPRLLSKNFLYFAQLKCTYFP